MSWDLPLIGEKRMNSTFPECSLIRSCLEYYRRSHVSYKKLCLGRSFVSVWRLCWWAPLKTPIGLPFTCERNRNVSAMSSNESYSGHSGGLVHIYRSGDCDAPACKREWRSRARYGNWALTFDPGNQSEFREFSWVGVVTRLQHEI